MPADAVELVHVSSVKTVKALQTVARFFTQVCTDIARHRYLPARLLLPILIPLSGCMLTPSSACRSWCHTADDIIVWLSPFQSIYCHRHISPPGSPIALTMLEVFQQASRCLRCAIHGWHLLQAHTEAAVLAALGGVQGMAGTLYVPTACGLHSSMASIVAR